MLGVAKILENMEIGHNVMHGQWDWMNDPEIHSSDLGVGHRPPAEQWKHSHNYVHHTFTNVIGNDNDVGYGILRMTRDRSGTRSTSASRSTTPCSRCSSSGASRCTTSTSRRSARARRTRRC